MTQILLDDSILSDISEQLRSGLLVPYLGPGVLRDVVGKDSGQPIPAESESLILAINDGQPMTPRLMYEFPRAAMHLENKKGRSFVERFLTRTYAQQQWTRGSFHEWLSAQRLPYVIDTNRDTQLQELWADRPHTLIVGAARIAATPYRFDLYENQQGTYVPRTPDSVNPALPVLFKPLGTPLPKPSYVASDADFVDYITELMGGFAIPAWVKKMRESKRYLLLGLRLTRDTERMLVTEILYGAANPAGWAFIPEPTTKELRFCARLNLQVIESDWSALLESEALATA